MEWKIDNLEEPLDEVFDRAERDGPQRIEHRGKHFLVIVEQGGKKDNALVRAFLDEPAFKGLDIERVNDPVRDIEW